MRPLMDAVHDAGHPVHVLPVLRPQPAPGPGVGARGPAYLDEHDLRDVLVLAHSKGGLIGKYAMTLPRGSASTGWSRCRRPSAGRSTRGSLPSRTSGLPGGGTR